MLEGLWFELTTMKETQPVRFNLMQFPLGRHPTRVPVFVGNTLVNHTTTAQSKAKQNQTPGTHPEGL